MENEGEGKPQEGKEGEPAKAQPKLGSPEDKTVLIVDDDETILNLLEILVRRDGFKVLTADSGEAALYRLARMPDLVLLDLMLPGSKSGIDVLRHLRTAKGHVPPVIVMTGQVDDHPEVKEAKADKNVSHFFRKPINQEKFLTLLHQTLKTRPPEKKGSGFKKWQE